MQKAHIERCGPMMEKPRYQRARSRVADELCDRIQPTRRAMPVTGNVSGRPDIVLSKLVQLLARQAALEVRSVRADRTLAHTVAPKR